MRVKNKISQIEKSKINQIRDDHEKDHFDKMANNYDRNYGYLNEFTKYKINKKIGILNGFIKKYISGRKIKLLDVACGTGEYVDLIAKSNKNVEVFGIDISPGMIKIAKNKCKTSNVHLSVASAYQTQFADSSFDILTFFYALHHLSERDLFPEIIRLLKPGGIVFFCEPNLLNPLVYAIKTIPILKKMAGDSPDERAVNPLTLEKNAFPLQKISIETGEFIPPTEILGTMQISLDHVLTNLSKVPFIGNLGGTVYAVFIKN